MDVKCEHKQKPCQMNQLFKFSDGVKMITDENENISVTKRLQYSTDTVVTIQTTAFQYMQQANDSDGAN